LGGWFWVWVYRLLCLWLGVLGCFFIEEEGYLKLVWLRVGWVCGFGLDAGGGQRRCCPEASHSSAVPARETAHPGIPRSGGGKSQRDRMKRRDHAEKAAMGATTISLSPAEEHARRNQHMDNEWAICQKKYSVRGAGRPERGVQCTLSTAIAAQVKRYESMGGRPCL